LQISFHALKSKYGWPDGSEVLVPALTFVASINTILQNKLTPVFVDIEKDFYGIDPSEIETKITPHTVAIEPVHLFGQPADMDPIMEIASRHHLKVVEDSCETMFALYKGKPVGSFGDISCFSTYAAHLLATGIGGLALTNDEALAIKLRSLINHGRDDSYLSIDDDDKINSKDFKHIVDNRFQFTDIGYSYRASELEAAIGFGQLHDWENMIRMRKANAQYLTKLLSSLEDRIQLPEVRMGTEHVYMVYPMVVKDPSVRMDDFIYHLETSGIETRPLLPTLSQPVYRKLYGDIEKDYPVAEAVSKRGLYVGCHQDLMKEDMEYVADIIAKYFRKN
jgi:dTDP-4-amino-4,6-dideoxygalactose transaminase